MRTFTKKFLAVEVRREMSRFVVGGTWQEIAGNSGSGGDAVMLKPIAKDVVGRRMPTQE